jgi:hypothetical protein
MDREQELKSDPMPARMSRWVARLSLLGGPVLMGAIAVGCASTTAAEPAHNAAEEAAASERSRCGPDLDEAALAPVLSGQAIESVEPLYTRLQGGKSGEGSRLFGAVVRVRAIQGMTAEWLDRALECHSARRVLGRIPETMTPNDPFWLPGRMVDIDAQSARDGFQVAVRGFSVDDAQEILIRANAFLASKQPGPAPH